MSTTQYTIFSIKKKVILNCPKSAAMGFFSKGLKNEFETAVVNEPSVFKPLKGLLCNLTVTILITDKFMWRKKKLLT